MPRAQIKIEDIVNIDFPAVKGATFPMAIYFKGKVSARNSPWVLNADSEVYSLEVVMCRNQLLFVNSILEDSACW